MVGFGGYVSVPAYLAAWRRHTPIVIHEVNVRRGWPTRWACASPSTSRSASRTRRSRSPPLRGRPVVGVPLRQAIADAGPGRAARAGARAHFGLDPDRPTLFVFGASQGARSINLAVSGAAKAITGAGVQVLHIIGARNETSRSRRTCPRRT